MTARQRNSLHNVGGDGDDRLNVGLVVHLPRYRQRRRTEAVEQSPSPSSRYVVGRRVRRRIRRGRCGQRPTNLTPRSTQRRRWKTAARNPRAGITEGLRRTRFLQTNSSDAWTTGHWLTVTGRHVSDSNRCSGAFFEAHLEEIPTATPDGKICFHFELRSSVTGEHNAVTRVHLCKIERKKI